MTNPTAELIAEWQRACGEDELANIHPLIRAGNALAERLERVEKEREEIRDSLKHMSDLCMKANTRLASLAPVPCSQRMPEEKDGPEVLWHYEAGYWAEYPWNHQHYEMTDPTHWLPVPEIT